MDPQPQYGANPAYAPAPPGMMMMTSVLPTGFVPTRCTCPLCGADVVTIVEFESGTLTIILVVLLVICQCWLGCCLIPLCIDGCKDAVHICPACSREIALVKRI